MALEQKNIIVLLLITSGSSFISTLSIIIYSFIRRKIFKSYPYELVLMLCISDFFFSSTNVSRTIWMLIDPDAYLSQNGCIIMGIHVQTWMLSSFICTSTIQYSIYMRVIKKEKTHIKSPFKRFWVVNYLIPFISGLVLFFSGSIGHVGPFENTFCFINAGDQLKTDIILLLFYYIPYITILVFNSIVIGLIINYYRKLQDAQTCVIQNEYKKLIFYPVILIICFFPVIISRILGRFGIQNDVFLQVGFIIDNLIGLFNSMFYFIFSINPCYLEKLQQLSICQKQNNEAISQLVIDQQFIQSQQEVVDLQQGILSFSNDEQENF
ncbi:hypothetical protein ABPG74_008933 [Tetrahymena malaccensis]